MIATTLKTGRPVARLNAWLAMTAKMTGHTERVVLDRLLEDTAQSEVRRASVARCTDLTPWFVFAWANDQRLNLIFHGAIAS